MLLESDIDDNESYIFHRMVQRAYTDSLHTTPINNVFLTIKQLSQRSGWHTARQNLATLAWLNSQRGAHRLLKRLSGHKKLLVLMAAKREPRYHQVGWHSNLLLPADSLVASTAAAESFIADHLSKPQSRP